MAKRVEAKTSRAILQEPITIKIGNRHYEVAQPSTATLIKVSEYICDLPLVELNSDNVLIESLSVAKDCRALGDIVATLILGAKGTGEKRNGFKDRMISFLWPRSASGYNRKRALAKQILEELTPTELGMITSRILSSMDIGSFFGLTASLIEINLLRQTRGAVTTASGQ